MKIVIIEPIGACEEKISDFKDIITKLGHTLFTYDTPPSDNNEILNRILDANIIILSNLKLKSEVIEKCTTLNMISIAFTGYDHVDIESCKKRGIIVCNAPGYSTDAVSELTLCLMISLLRNIVELDKKTRKYLGREGLGLELKGKTLGIIGTGAIGLKVAKLGLAFECEILAYSKTKKDVSGVNYVSLDNLLKNSDIITIHTPLNPNTIKLINKNNILLMKKSSIIINTARGGLIDNDALKEALNEGRIAGAGIDVYDYEPPLNADYPLLKAKNTILLPHIGFATKEAINRRTDIVFENVINFLENKPQNRVI